VCGERTIYTRYFPPLQRTCPEVRLQHAATTCNTHCKEQQHTFSMTAHMSRSSAATRCNNMKHTQLQNTVTYLLRDSAHVPKFGCNTLDNLQHKLQRTATHLLRDSAHVPKFGCNTLQQPATHTTKRQQRTFSLTTHMTRASAATHCNNLQQTLQKDSNTPSP